jgi:tRNA dimethylallyltransferase
MKWHCEMPVAQRPEFLVVGGPTASGKSAVAIELAKAFSGTLICCDSVQLYRGFDIGSAKPSKDERAIVPHLLFDEFLWSEPCDAAIYALKAKDTIAKVRASGRLPIIVGGTGLYLRALLGDDWDEDIPSDETLRKKLSEKSSLELFSELQAIDPRRAAQLHINDRFRVIRALEINILTGSPVKEASVQKQKTTRQHFFIYMNPPRDVLYARINERTTLMLRAGLVDEVQKMLDVGVSPACKPMGSIGYKETVLVLQGALLPSDLESAIATATRQYAKRQVTWFKKVTANVELSDVSEVSHLIHALKDTFGALKPSN